MEEVVVQLYPFIALNLAIVVPGLMSLKGSALSLQQVNRLLVEHLYQPVANCF